MATFDQPGVGEEIESQILAILREHPKLTFTSLADAVPERRWRELFGALNVYVNGNRSNYPRSLGITK